MKTCFWTWMKHFKTLTRSTQGLYGEHMQLVYYLKDTGHRLWWSHITWSVSEAGTRLIPCQYGDLLQPRHPCCKHNHHKSLEIWDRPSLRQVSILPSCVLYKVCQEWVRGKGGFLGHSWHSLPFAVEVCPSPTTITSQPPQTRLQPWRDHREAPGRSPKDAEAEKLQAAATF